MTRFRLFILALALVLAFVLAVLFVTPPRPVVRALAVWSAPYVMEWEGTPLQRTGRKIVGSYLQTALASHIAKANDETVSDEQALIDIIIVVQKSGLNQLQFDHIAKTWPVLLVGFGYCDQINGSVAAIASHRFPKAQIFGLYNEKEKHSPHTIGRVWSRQRGEWLYYDAFFEVPVVFIKGSDNTPHFLGPRPSHRMTSRGEPNWGLYRLPGWAFAEFRPTFAGLLMARAEKMRAPAAAPRLDPVISGAVPAKPTAVLASVTQQEPPVDADAFRHVARSYIAARVDHLLTGKTDQEHYRAVASDAVAARDFRANEIAHAAERLAMFGE